MWLCYILLNQVMSTNIDWYKHIHTFPLHLQMRTGTLLMPHFPAFWKVTHSECSFIRLILQHSYLCWYIRIKSLRWYCWINRDVLKMGSYWHITVKRDCTGLGLSSILERVLVLPQPVNLSITLLEMLFGEEHWWVGMFFSCTIFF